MAKQVIPEELDLLIQEYLTDGIITAKERAVLLRKAEKLGLDVDEIDLYIDAQQQKADEAVNAAVSKKRGGTCPYCGGSVPQLTDKCPHCGQHITVEASDELKEIIENLEEALVDLKDPKNYERSKAMTERYVRKAKLYFSNNPKIKSLLEEVNIEIEAAEKKHRAQNTWIKKHPFLFAWFIIMAIAFVFPLFAGGNVADAVVALLLASAFGGFIVLMCKISVDDNKKEKEKEAREYELEKMRIENQRKR